MVDHTERGAVRPAHSPAHEERGGSRRGRRTALTAVTVGGLAAGPLLLASALSSPGSAASSVSPSGSGLTLVAAAAPTPPAGMSWIQGTLTDQAGHRLNNVNVEAWSPDPTDLGPVASNLSYAGDYTDPRHQSGVFRLEVPGGTGYRLTFSTINGQEDGDRFRALAYGGGRPILARTVSGASVALAATPGRVINLGTIRLARQGHVASTTSVRLAKSRIKAGRRALAVITLASPYVSKVAGKVRIQVGKKVLTRAVGAGNAGRITVKLPKTKPGGHLVQASFMGSATVAPSTATPVRLVVTRKK